MLLLNHRKMNSQNKKTEKIVDHHKNRIYLVNGAQFFSFNFLLYHREPFRSSSVSQKDESNHFCQIRTKSLYILRKQTVVLGQPGNRRN